jgi:50S ribosomal protein L16 3-hydroxylase
MKILTKILQDTPLEMFLEKHFTKIPYSSPRGAQDFKHLLNWKVVEDVMDKKNSFLRIVQDGRVIRDYVELSYDEARDHHKKGHTLLLRYAEKSHSDLMSLAQDFAGSFHTDVDIQLYCTPEGHNAFGWHYDVEEVFIIQTKGSKHYTIRPNTVHPNPLISSIPKDLEYEKEKTPIEIQVTLKEGDWLYIPSGWWHIAKTQAESMHISIGLMPSSAVDILNFLPQHLSHNKFWRTRMPVHKKFKNSEEEVTFYRDAMLTLGKDMTKHLSSDEFIQEFLKYKKSFKKE